MLMPPDFDRGRLHRILWLIPARSGSKSIAHKNIKELGGHPLLAYRAASVRSLAASEDVWISTDSRDYAEIAARYGVEAPFLRPADLASDAAPSDGLVLHAMKHAAGMGRRYAGIGLLQPTSPFVTPASLRRAAERLFSDDGADSVVAVREAFPGTWYVQKAAARLDELVGRLREEGFKRRQEVGREITPSGGFYIARWDSYLKSGTFYCPATLAFELSGWETLDIDEPVDWDWAEFLIKSGRVDPAAFGLDQDGGSRLP